MPFESIDVSIDERAFEGLKRFGVLRVPIIARGERWVDGQSLDALARFVGVDWTHQRLSPELLATRIDSILEAAMRLAAALPEDKLAADLPMLKTRKRAYGALAVHIGQVVECFVNLVEHGKRLEFEHLDAPIPQHIGTRAELLAFLAGIQRRFEGWWARAGRGGDLDARADVYYGEQTLHEFLERTAWHAGQHARQLQAALAELGIALQRPLRDEDLQGLPLPEHIFD